MYFVSSRHKPAAGAVGAFVPQAPGSRGAGALLHFGSEPWFVWPDQMSTGGTEAHREHIPVEHTAGRSQVCHWSAALGCAAAWQHRNSH